MLSLIYGRPGTGKTYEAVKFHILPNLKLGNKVYTNIPVNLEDPNLEVNDSPKIHDIVNIIDSSEHEITFILDEFQFLLQEDEEAWFQLFAQHRKFRTDFFIITQSPLSLPEKIQDLISFAHKT
ncbi:Zonular occludens toxin, partial [Vibrio agarivorans]